MCRFIWTHPTQFFEEIRILLSVLTLFQIWNLENFATASIVSKYMLPTHGTLKPCIRWWGPGFPTERDTSEGISDTPLGIGRVQSSRLPDATISTRRGRRAAAMRAKATIAVATSLAHPAAKSMHGGLYVSLLFLTYLFICSDSCQTNYLKMHLTDLCYICRVGR